MSSADDFIDHFNLNTAHKNRPIIEEIGHAFATFPYENITKLIAKYKEDGIDRRRQPAQVFSEHLDFGAGGTCFALTKLFAAVLLRLGYDSRPVLCNMPRRGGLVENAHCALLIDNHGEDLLVDPGYLLHQPLSFEAKANPDKNPLQAELKRIDSDHYELFTFGKRRYQLKLAPVSEDEFNRVWDESFDWTMMNNLHICSSLDQGGFQYMHGEHLRVQQNDGKKENLNLAGKLEETIKGRFGIDPKLIKEASMYIERIRAEKIK